MSQMHRATRTSRACLQLSLLPLLLLASACHGPLNDANGLYGSTPLPALGEPVQQRPMLSEENSGVAPLDRSQWLSVVAEDLNFLQRETEGSFHN